MVMRLSLPNVLRATKDLILSPIFLMLVCMIVLISMNITLRLVLPTSAYFWVIVIPVENVLRRQSRTRTRTLD